jgi:integrase
MQTFLEKKYDLKLVNSPRPYRLCKIRDYDKSLDKTWHVEYYVFDEDKQEIVRRRTSLTHKTAKQRYAEGKKISAEINERLISGAVLNKALPEVPLDKPIEISKIQENSLILTACKSYSDHIEKVLAKKTYETYNTDIKRFTIWIRANDLNIPIFDFQDYQAQRFLDSLAGNISNRSINNNKNSLVTLFNFFNKRFKKKLETNPFSGIEDLPAEAKKHRPFLPHEREAFKKAAVKAGEFQLLLFCEFIYYTFLRPGKELRFLKVSDILPNRTIRVESITAKGKETDFIGIPKPLWKVIKKLDLLSYSPDFYVFGEDGNPGKHHVIRDFFYDKHVLVLKAAELHRKGFDLYAWKHTGACTLYQETKNIFVLQRQCRHKDLDSTLKYVRDLGLFVDLKDIDLFPEF